MANKKFSEFTTKTTSATVDSIVGITGSDNVKITPANFLSPALQTYPVTLAGTNVPSGTITGHYVNFGKLYQVFVSIDAEFADMSTQSTLNSITLPASAKNVTTLKKQGGTIGHIDNLDVNSNQFNLFCAVDKNTNTLDFFRRTSGGGNSVSTGILFEDDSEGSGEMKITIQITYLAE